ncbi:ATP-dependent RNA helicase DDX24 [Lepeophtheirus salmonis]|uniref:ATP-dependent RNA helicase DDX24 n=1 Tax=Lepeophtheirus salmonis TaxID=72036 RepID=UPI001AEA2301|nr:ATP-dependent RNA helicase DDX24-like [Lepeophtheirus salmonis]
MVKKNRSRIQKSWQHIPLDANLMAKGAKEGLLGIEELTDYTLHTKSNRGKPKKIPVKNAPGFKGSKDLTIYNHSDSEDEPEEQEQTKGKKKKSQDTKTKKKKVSKKESKGVVEESHFLNDMQDKDEELVFESDDESSVNYHKELPEWSNVAVPEVILKAIYELGFKVPTPIQRLTLQAAISGRMDIVGAAETGSGKTLAFGIPILNGILECKENEETEDEDETEAAEEFLAEDEEESDCDMETDQPNDDNQENDLSSEEEPLDLEKEEDNESGSEDEMENAGMGCVKVIDNIDFGDIENGFVPKYKSKSGKLYAVILTPTRELAVQIKNHLTDIGKYTNIKTAVIVGGMAPQKQIRVLSHCPEIVVATPGRLWDLIQEGNPHLSKITDVKYLAIDETDRMVEKGHFEELQQLLELINENAEKKEARQTFVFSATLSLVHEPPKKNNTAGKKIMKALTPKEKLKSLTSIIGVKEKRVKVVDITRKLGTVETLTESRIHCKIDEKDYFLYYILVQHPGRTMVFCNSIDCVRRLVNLFQYLLVEPLGLHAQMHQKQRLKNLERFTQNENSILIATDVAARGLDIPHVEHVVHYQVPRTSESYIHRSGRTARANREGISVMFIEPKETHAYRKICNTLNRDEELPMFPISDELMCGIKERVNIAREYDKLSLFLRKEEVSKSWMRKAAEEADLEYFDSDDEEEDEGVISQSKKKIRF